MITLKTSENNEKHQENIELVKMDVEIFKSSKTHLNVLVLVFSRRVRASLRLRPGFRASLRLRPGSRTRISDQAQTRISDQPAAAGDDTIGSRSMIRQVP